MSDPTSLLATSSTSVPSQRAASADLLTSILGDRLPVGHLTITLPDGTRRDFSGHAPGPRATVRIHRLRVLRRLLIGGAVGLGEAYMDGDWDSPDLATVLELGDHIDQASGQPMQGRPLLRWLHRLWHRWHDNSRRGSRRNIAAHYDLGNAFYRQWLDPGMTYSAALFDPAQPDQTLEQAQTAKYRALADDLGLRPGMTVLEIGCGWGGFAEVAARDYGVSVVGLTLSREQHDYATARLHQAGLAERVDIRLQDYRDVRGQFDRIASIEMIEAVGERWWPTYFATLHDRLHPGGMAGLQAITIADARFAGYRRGCDFIQRYVFPGGMLPSPTVLEAQAARAGLSLSTPRCFGADYDRTLALWGEAFRSRWDSIAPLGFDVRFRRLWDFYLAYCQAGFRTGAIDVRHLLLRRA